MRLIAVSLTVILSGCAIPPVVESGATDSRFSGAVYEGEEVEIASPTLGAVQHRVFQQGASSFSSLGGVVEDVERSAEKFCERQESKMRPVSMRRSVPPHILGNFPRAELVFECVKASRSSSGSIAQDRISQIERLKKLKDDGALSDEEYAREKALVLGSQR